MTATPYTPSPNPFLEFLAQLLEWLKVNPFGAFLASLLTPIARPLVQAGMDAAKDQIEGLLSPNPTAALTWIRENSTDEEWAAFSQQWADAGTKKVLAMIQADEKLLSLAWDALTKIILPLLGALIL